MCLLEERAGIFLFNLRALPAPRRSVMYALLLSSSKNNHFGTIMPSDRGEYQFWEDNHYHSESRVGSRNGARVVLNVSTGRGR